MKRFVITCLFVAAAGIVGCGGNGNNNMNGMDMRGVYPAGPYGKAEGAVIEPLAFMLHDGNPRSLEDVWKDETKKLLLINTSAGWCAACIEEQPALRMYHEKYGPKGLAILEAIFENSDGDPATMQLADNWKRQYMLPFDVVVDASPFQLGAYYQKDLSPMNMIVDVQEMKILKIIIGVDPNQTEAIFDARLK